MIDIGKWSICIGGRLQRFFCILINAGIHNTTKKIACTLINPGTTDFSGKELHRQTGRCAYNGDIRAADVM